MSDVTVRFPEGGDVTIEGLDGVSYSHLHIEDVATTWTCRDVKVRVERNRIELFYCDRRLINKVLS